MKNYKELLEQVQPFAEETFAKIDKKMCQVALRSRNKVPDGVDENGYHVEQGITWWTNGFFGGMNWLLYNKTKNEDYRLTAENNEVLMDKALCQFTALHHDVGFMWHLLSGASYALTGNTASRTRSLFAASTLASRFVLFDDAPGGFIRAWNGPTNCSNYNWSIVDCLMNLPILYFASRETGDDRFKRIAMAHADMSIRDHLRDDGSIAHVIHHDRKSGEATEMDHTQGYCKGSSWSRGQAWALYGFTISYIHTGEERYLNAAKKVANYFIANCCDDWLPRADFRAPSEPVYYDSSAGACAACGLIELAKHLPENEGGMYMHAAINLMKAMSERFANYDPANDHLLDYGSKCCPNPNRTEKDAGIHMSLIYADYFFVEATLKLLGSEFFTW